MYRWDKKDVPHKGWMHIGVDDLGEATHTCEMCNKEEIRYVHTMYHPEAPDYFRVGCVCAENLLEDYILPKKLLKDAKNKSNRQKKFINEGWIQLSYNRQEKIYKYNTCSILKLTNNKVLYALNGVSVMVASVEEAKLELYQKLFSK